MSGRTRIVAGYEVRATPAKGGWYAWVGDHLFYDVGKWRTMRAALAFARGYVLRHPEKFPPKEALD